MAAKFLIDTNIWIHYFKKKYGVGDKMALVSADDMFCLSIYDVDEHRVAPGATRHATVLEGGVKIDDIPLPIHRKRLSLPLRMQTVSYYDYPCSKSYL